MAEIHATAIVHKDAEIDSSVEIGPYCIVEAGVKIGARTKLHAKVSILGKVEIGEDCELFPNVVVGARPQILNLKPGFHPVSIGNRTVLRENVTIHGATAGTGEATRLGDDCYVMVNGHLGHDVQTGNKCVFANSVMIGGHCRVGDQVWTGGGVAVHQFTWIGDHAFIAGGCILTGDVIPFAVAEGNPSHFMTLNAVGLTRRGFSRTDLQAIRSAVKFIFEGSENTFADRIAKARSHFVDNAHAAKILDFLESPRSGRKLCPYSR